MGYRSSSRVMSADKYGSFAELRASEPAGHWRAQAVVQGAGRAVIAPHGSSIEPGTSEIAKAIASDDLDLYVFEGLKPVGNRDLHITSIRFDEPVGLKLLSAASRVVAIHGEGSGDKAVTFLRVSTLSFARQLSASFLRAGSRCAGTRTRGSRASPWRTSAIAAQAAAAYSSSSVAGSGNSFSSR